MRAIGDGVNYSNSEWTNSNATTDAPSIDSLPLNIEGGQVGFSLRKIRTGYSGSAVRVRRSSDNTEQDIGFSGADFDVASFSSFVGGGNGFIVTWYDQGTNGYNATQATAANQPQITLSAENGHPVATFDGTDYLTIASSEGNFKYLHSTGGSILVAGKAGTTADPGVLYAFAGNLAGTSTKTGFNLYFNDVPSANNGLRVFVGNSTSGQLPIDRNESNVFTPNAFNLLYTTLDPDNGTAANRLDYWVNNAAITVTNSNSFTPVTTNSTHPLQIGANGNSGSIYVGTIAEIIFFNVIHSTATRDAVAADMDTYYDIY